MNHELYRDTASARASASADMLPFVMNSNDLDEFRRMTADRFTCHAVDSADFTHLPTETAQ